VPTKEPGNAPAIPSVVTWDQFAKLKQRKARTSLYMPFVLAMKIKTVYDATASFPKVDAAKIRNGLYGQARKTGRKVVFAVEDGKLLVALKEAPSGKES
jgi:hypothetical protein